MSEPAEVQEALLTVSQALTSLKEHTTITWLLESGFDDMAVWRTIWEAQEHLVCRVYHLERLISFQDRTGQWQEGNLGQARGHLRKRARDLLHRHPGVGEQVAREVWLVEVHIMGTDQDPWVRLPDWPVTDEQSAAFLHTWGPPHQL